MVRSLHTRHKARCSSSLVVECHEAMIFNNCLLRSFRRSFSVYRCCEAHFCVAHSCLWDDSDSSGRQSTATLANVIQTTQRPHLTMHHTKSWDMVSTEEVLTFIQDMQEPPSVEDFMYILQKCRKEKILQHLSAIHAHLCSNGLEASDVLGNILLHAYLECKILAEANRVLNKLLHADEFSWTALIQGYNEYGDFEDALHLFTLMRLQFACPSKYAYVAGLKACAGQKYVKLSQQIHAEIVEDEMDLDPYIINSLVGVYSKCGLLQEARKVFQQLSIPSVVSWTALMSGYADYGVGDKVLHCVEQMRLEGTCPNAFTIACCLRACTSRGALNRGQHVHSVIVGVDEHQNDPFVGNALVDMYAKCGKFEVAQKVFNLLRVRDVITWTTLITGFNEYGFGEKALDHLEEMQAQRVSMNAICFASSLKACATLRIPERGQVLHDAIIKTGLELDQVLGNSLIDMYAKFGSLSEAQKVFEQLPARNAISYNALIAGYSEQGLHEKALVCMQRLYLEDVCMDATSCIISLKTCGSLKDLNKGLLLHIVIIQEGFDTDTSVGNSFVDMYTKCHACAEAMHVFTKLPSRSVIAWTACIAVYLDEGLAKEALIALEKSQTEGVSPDEVIFVYGLQACGMIRALDEGQEVHSQIVKHGFESFAAVSNTLIDMYDKCHSLADAYHLFVQLPIRTPASWSALIGAYAEHDLCGEALVLMEQIELEGLPPNTAAYASSLRACGTLGAAKKGRELHCELVKKGLALEPSIESGEQAGERAASVVAIGNGLIDMYAKCKNMGDALFVFHKLPKLSLETWNVLMVGYTRTGEEEFVFSLFGKMYKEGILPNEVTCLSLLTACSHAGLVEKGERFFTRMNNEFGIGQTLEHHNCMIDLLGRAGQLPYAVKLLEEMPSQPNMSSWNTILAACRKWGNVELARKALECAMRLDENHAAAFISMYNIYADANMWTDAKRIRSAGKKVKAR